MSYVKSNEIENTMEEYDKLKENKKKVCVFESITK